MLQNEIAARLTTEVHAKLASFYKMNNKLPTEITFNYWILAFLIDNDIRFREIDLDQK